MNLKYLVVSATILVGHFINAQNFRGQVLDRQNNGPIQEAHILLNNKIAAYSDSYGAFELTLPQKGATLSISGRRVCRRSRALRNP